MEATRDPETRRSLQEFHDAITNGEADGKVILIKKDNPYSKARSSRAGAEEGGYGRNGNGTQHNLIGTKQEEEDLTMEQY